MTFEEELKEHGRFIFSSQGSSMRPLIRSDRDVVEISARSGPLKKYDVVLYKSRDGRYVLHRIIHVGEHGCDLLGDNNLRMERGVKEEQIIGVLSSVLRDGTRRLKLDSLSYRLYVALWCRLYPLRIALLWLKGRAGALYRRILPRR